MLPTGTRLNKLQRPWSPGYKVVRQDGDDFYIVARLELDGALGSQVRVPARRILLQQSDRKGDGIEVDLKPDHYIVESVVGHKRADDGSYSFIVKWKNFGPDDNTGAVLADLLRNNRPILQKYCDANKINFKDVTKRPQPRKTRG